MIKQVQHLVSCKLSSLVTTFLENGSLETGKANTWIKKPMFPIVRLLKRSLHCLNLTFGLADDAKVVKKKRKRRDLEEDPDGWFELYIHLPRDDPFRAVGQAELSAKAPKTQNDHDEEMGNFLLLI